MRLTLMFVVLLAVAFAFPAMAQDQNALSLNRLSIATGLDYAWYTPQNDGTTLPTLQKKEWEIPLNLAYNLLATPTNKPLLSVIAGTSWGFDSHILKTRVGLRLILFTGGN